jgi:hypothetical protein
MIIINNSIYPVLHPLLNEYYLCRVIDSHPYENVGDDGRPLAGRESSESVIPDYETIFVKVSTGIIPEKESVNKFLELLLEIF